MTEHHHSNVPVSYHEADDEGYETPPADEESPSKRQKVRLLASRAKNKIKELPDLVAERAADETPTPNVDDSNLSDDPAFNPGLILNGSPQPKQPSSPDGKRQKLKQAGDAIIHPRRAIREKTTRVTASKISESQRPYLSPEQDLELLRADDDLSRAASRASSTYQGDSPLESSTEEAARARLQNIQDNREGLKTAWAIGRHVVRVKAVRKPGRRPRKQDFTTSIPADQQRFEWEKWLGHILLWYTRGFTSQYIDDFGDQPPFDVQELSRLVERLAIVSAPWQSFFIDVRSIYIWQDKRRTARWCALYWLLWYTEHLGAFVYAYIIYATLRNKFYPTSVESVRKAMARSMDRQAKAQAWGELIEKHGRSDWMEPLIKDMGPLIQMQLGDLTNFVEVLVNFHRWERPSKTAATLFWYACGLLITLLTDMHFCIKLISFIVGGGFFFCWPLAVRYPQYRIVLDPVRWVFWDIPTHAELGFIQLQEKAILKDAKDFDEATPSERHDHEPIGSDSDYFSAEEEVQISQQGREIKVRAYKDKHRGYLFLNRHSVTFSSHHASRTTLSLSHVTEIRKLPVNSKSELLISFQSDTERLEFDFYSDSDSGIETLSLMVRRSDQQRIFNHALAWSGLKWQALHLQRYPDAEEGRKEIDKAVRSIVHGKT